MGKDTFKAKVFFANTFACGTWRGLGKAVVTASQLFVEAGAVFLAGAEAGAVFLAGVEAGAVFMAGAEAGDAR